jgi:hypothetical protein
LVRSEEVELGDDGVVVADVHPDVLVALVRERSALGAVVRQHGLFAVVDLAGGDDLVAGVTGEGRDRTIELLVDLRGEVLLEQVEALLAQLGGDHR